MCLGEFGTVVVACDATASVEFDDGSVRSVSTAVLAVDGIDLAPGDRVLVSMGMALRLPDTSERFDHRAST